jgi:S-adenosylmethionine-dependent methyltransferase
VNQRRCELYELEAQFLCANAAQLRNYFQPGSFDLIIFFATLEHLTVAERLAAMKASWELLLPDALWSVIETPNRLWWFDGHTSCLSFYHWLPDDLALQYAVHSPRSFMHQYSVATEASRLDFARRGRGVSYHEFELALGPVQSLKVISALNLYLRTHSLVLRAKWQLSSARKFERFLCSHGPRIHSGFYQPDLDLIIRK